MGPVMPTSWFCEAHELRLCFHNGWKIKVLFCDTYNSNVKACKQTAGLICLHIFYGCFCAITEELRSWQRLDGLHSWRYVLSGLLQKIVCWSLVYVIYTFRCNLGFWIFILFFSETLKKCWTFPEKNATAILLWKHSDSLGWFERTPFVVSPAWNSASLSHLNTLELSLDGKARSYCQPVLLLLTWSALWV